MEALVIGLDLIVGDAFVRGMRDIGYKSTSYAMAEIIDNSVQANATWLDVVFGFNNGAKPAKIAIIDNGWGMVPATGRSRRSGARAPCPDYRQGFGKYGYGLPSASGASASASRSIPRSRKATGPSPTSTSTRSAGASGRAGTGRTRPSSSSKSRLRS